jgi:carboxylate-amine ligase
MTALATEHTPIGTPVGVTLGVEEEFVLTDRAGRPVAAADDVLRDLSATDELRPELAGCQVELATPVCTRGEEVLARLRTLRARLAAAADERGLSLLATGTAPAAGDGAALADGDRYRRMAGHYRALTASAQVCGCHVHVGVPDRAAAIRVSNHLRPWLPVLLAAGANSPFWAGADSGYATWRHQLLVQWPASGPPPHFESVDHHDSVVAGLARAGGVLDAGSVYWYTRLSTRYPTVEVRVCDVAGTAGEATLLAALVRALAVTAVSGARTERVPDEVLRADLWRAARDGLAGSCAAPAGTTPVPAGIALRRLVDHVRPALRAVGEDELVDALLAGLLASGDGATRQRAAHRWRGRLADVAAVLAVQTATDRFAPNPLGGRAGYGAVAG